ncbi:Dbl homology domain-containing protein [Chlamydoabsidia padenii]|nr:Dbl homology domain-containing protein [Chlamydoabsidia padenii]
MSSLVQKQTSKSSKYARFIMMELLSTEENYMNDLYIIKTKFMDPLLYASQQPRPIINNRDIRTIFAFIPQLLLLSATLVQHLKTAIKNTNLTSEHDDERPCDLVGRILYNLETSFDIYVYYAVNFRKSRKCLDRIDCDSLCYQLLQESSIRRKETKRMDLNNFMITPIQRITRYCLILKDLQKHSSQCLLLDRSVKCMTSLAFAMNEIQ